MFLLKRQFQILATFILTCCPLRAATDNAEYLIVPSGENYTISGAHTYSKSIQIDGVLNVTGYDGTANTGWLELSAPQVTINSGGYINANSRGFRGGLGTGGSGEGPGGGYYGGGGASYGGESRNSPPCYGSITNPDDLGSGGGNGNGVGGYGGGKIKISANTIVINGNIGAIGGNGAGGGSGGSIYMVSRDLSGTGTVMANGGITSSDGLAGGGGRIAIYYRTNNFTGSIFANGGRSGNPYGGAGTIYKKSEAQTYGDVIVDSNYGGTDISVNSTCLFGQFDTVTVKSLGIVKTTATFATAQLSVSNRGSLTNSGNARIDALTVANDGVVYNKGGNFTVNGMASIAAGGVLIIDSPITANNLEILSGGKVSHSSISPGFSLTVNGTLNIASGGSIDVSGKGYRGGDSTVGSSGDGEGPGAGKTGWRHAGGGGYGGNGGSGVADPGILAGVGGEAYGNVAEPNDMGSGGGKGGSNGGNGGGKLRLAVSGTLNNNGMICANGSSGEINGSSGWGGGGGSGGGVYIIANAISGSGKICANGGNGGESMSGGGGGGRVGIYYKTSSFTGSLEAKAGMGGQPFAADGTVVKPTPDANSPMNISEAAITYLQEREIRETIFCQDGQLSADAVGNLSGTVSFSKMQLVTIRTGAFSDKGFIKSDWAAQLEGVNHQGQLRAMIFFNSADRKIHVKGSMEGNVSGILDGCFSESFPQNNNFDQFNATWTFRYSRTDGTYSCGAVQLRGTVSYGANQQYPNTALNYLQTSAAGTMAGSYSGALNTVLTNVWIKDSAHPNFGEGFGLISYQTQSGSGQSWFYSRSTLPESADLLGMFSGPVSGRFTGTMVNRTTEKSLWLVIYRLDIGVAPKADLKLDVFAPEGVSPGQTVTYTVRVKNEGLVPANNIKVQLALPLEARFLSASGDYFYADASESEWMSYSDPSIIPEWVSWYLTEIPARTEKYFSVQAKLLWGLSTNQIRGDAALYMENSTIGE